MSDAHSEQDWRAWFAEHGARLRLVARQWTRCEADADDVVQEAFVRFWKHQRHLPGNPNALVITSIRRAALDLLRRSDRRTVRERAVAADADVAEWFEPEADPRLQALANSLPSLSAEQREVVVLKIWGDLTFDQIGEQLEISPNTAASRWRYAMDALRKLITARTYE
ncbi:MAG: sigma-70 family RNA polymerase sigma factor [Verrucomicrobia bacterium]|nr:sigma-70 family RNA polymerase sigma factor [Verrucomicrobiota bacterium]NBS04046.1 sigma-70 family RNA polymerase sigma factor [Verrucomicrobiota bacterium]NBY37129.1 sigma-70 family RNA polymerase sigma factor [Verrucomicrobiota bacterium]